MSAYATNQLVFWFDDKKLLFGADDNLSLSKKKKKNAHVIEN